MSGDEYDEQSLDDEIEERLKSPANEALERLLAREPPTEGDVKLVERFYKKLADQERMPFLVARKGFVLGFEWSVRAGLIGYDYLRRTCQSATRTHRSDRYISSLELDSGGAVGEGGMIYSGDREGNYGIHDDNDFGYEAMNQQAKYEEVIERTTMRLMVEEKNKLKKKKEQLEEHGETLETREAELLVFYETELDSITHQGRIGSADPEEEKVRQKVWQAVEYAYEDMEDEDTGTKELRLIAAYFRKHIKRGIDFSYTGRLQFRFF